MSGGPIVNSNVLILGASYGSLLATKLLMAGQRVTLVVPPELLPLPLLS